MHYVYDSVNDSTHGCVWTNSGDLVEKQDAAGNFICYKHDGLHRLTDIYYYGTYASKTPEKHFVYDNATVNSVAMAYAVGRLAEAYTGPSNSKITDEGFSYSKRGEIVNVYEKTPNSGGYYRASETYWANGLINTLGLYNPAASAVIPTITYAPDGEGRVGTVSAASGQHPVLGTTYNPASLPTTVVIGSDPGGSDKDTYTYDPNTDRLTNYSFTVNNISQSVTLGWNANGSLVSQQVVDGFNSANTQNCTYVHDNLGRISNVNCGTGWTQSFTIDPFGNVAKSGSLSFSALYGIATNRITNYSSSYDSDGNLTGINLGTSHTYSWDAEGRPVAMDSLSITYDAFGRMVEQNNGGTYKQIVYGPGGTKLALMNGGTLNEAFVALPAGSQAVYTSSGLDHYRHSDWLGTSRLSTTNLRGLYSDAAYAPYGEYYAATGNTDVSYTGQNQDTVPGNANGAQYDFTYRQYSPVQGRWLSPDPLGLGAVNIANPQTWNRYAYVGNSPMNRMDSLGLCGWELWGYYWVNKKTGEEELIGTYLIQGPPCDGGGGAAGAASVIGAKNANNVACPTVPQAPDGVDVNKNIKASQWMQIVTYTSPVLSLYVFKKTVNNKGPWDYKQYGWTLTDWGQLGPSPYQDFGNFNYGATGAAWGVPLNVLLRGAGYAQSAAGTSTPDWGHWYQGPPHGDDPADQAQITAGYQYYKNGCYKKN